MKKVSIIIVNYNTRDVLRDCLKNLKNTASDSEIIVVDNASYDSSADMVEKEFSFVKLIRTQNNGLSAGYNFGIKQSTSDYLLFLGTDCFPEKDTIIGVLEYMESHPNVGVATCKLLLRDGKLDMDAHRGFPTPWAAFTHFSGLGKLFPDSELFNSYFLGYQNFEREHEIDLCISHFMMVKRQVFEKVGLWDEDFFVYGEDVDFCYRVKQAGIKIMYLPKWKATHYKGVTVGIRKESVDVATASGQTKSRMKKASIEAMKIFYKKHYINRYPKFVNWLVFSGIDLLTKIRNR